MSKYKLEKTLRRELGVLNEQIDLKIIKGLSYAREARRHKFLVSRLSDMQRESKSNASWFSKSFNFVSII